ncbi:DUF3630 family protein [Thalassotalea sp. LPB0316]|uniref:DUF3630 family protein n=1 Tax=Thalassotalea sp. LPB0316 TaxID=2769490 RepID=UPI0018664CAD|nr:DUF3630 family protein [Thalassotalea sp. LPB0316]QOL26290.1 DUF3630 family protein [Thalassotalea sp. LPB0316]
MQQLITSVDYIRHETSAVIQVYFLQSWRQDDVTALAEDVFSLFDDVTLIEHAQGADIETFHIRVDTLDLLVNFELYSASCWLEVVNHQDTDSLRYIFENVNKKLAKCE